MKKVSARKSIQEQVVALRSKYPQFNTSISRNTLIVTGSLQPTPRSSTYSFVLRYVAFKPPMITITNPKLVRNEKGEKIPHMYGQKRLCLYQPKYREFKSSDFLSQTVVPWTSLWLYYYEKWHLTGDWLGGGEHP